jgi:hypothetical protein
MTSGTAAARANKQIDTRSGRASTDAGIAGGANGSVNNATSSQLGTVAGDGTVGATASKSTSTSVQAVGTDQVRGAAHQTTNTARAATRKTRNTARNATDKAVRTTQSTTEKTTGAVSNSATGSVAAKGSGTATSQIN